MTTVTCSSGVELLMDYLEGVLPANMASDIEAHVSQCPRCTAFIESYRETPRIFREAMAAALPEDMAASLLQFLRARRAEPS